MTSSSQVQPMTAEGGGGGGAAAAADCRGNKATKFKQEVRAGGVKGQTEELGEGGVAFTSQIPGGPGSRR